MVEKCLGREVSGREVSGRETSGRETSRIPEQYFENLNKNIELILKKTMTSAYSFYLW